MRFAFAVSVLLVACGHTEPFQLGDYGSAGPLAGGNPTRLTYNPGQDLQPKWLADGSILYTAERWDRVDHDRCLAFLPAAGGAISRYVCRTTAADDSINVFEDVALRGDSIVYVRTSTQIYLQSLGPRSQELVIAALSHPNQARVLQNPTFTATWGTTYDAMSHVAWLTARRVAAIGERVTYPVPCRTCARDTVRTGLDILIIDFATATPVLTRLAGGDSASSVAASSNGDTLYFTRDGDSRVYRHVFSSDATDTLYDFGLGIARDVTVGGGKLAAVVGGAVSYAVDSILGGSQPDHGGALFLMNPGNSPIQIGDPSWLFRRPALAADGVHLITSAWIGQPTADVWVFQLP